MTPVATTKDAYKLLHDGAMALSRVEAAGMRVDLRKLDMTVAKLKARVKGLAEEQRADPIWTAWRRRFGEKTNPRSRTQLGTLIFDVMGYESKKTTATGRPKTDDEALSQLDIPFVDRFQRIEKINKWVNTYLVGLRREVVGEYVHPVFNLHLVRTYRSSCDSPNLQNVPVRDVLAGELVRSCFIPRDGHVLVEIDFKSLEVNISTCYHHDPTLIRYLQDATTDMHRDAACDIYMLEPDQVTKDIRFYGKNGWVFPQFYGSVWFQCAPELWKALEKDDLKTANGVSLRRHLKRKGITRLGACDPDLDPVKGTFEHHVKEVQELFWSERFPVYSQWKHDWFGDYGENGYFDLYTGFRIWGYHKKNDVINYPVQGAAFHCLLWSLIQLVKWLRKRKMKSKIVGQIHDSIVADVHRDELEAFVAEARDVMTRRLLQHWKWINVPLEIEVEVGEENWHEKKEVSL